MTPAMTAPFIQESARARMPLTLRIMFVLAGALFAVAFMIMGVRAQAPVSNTVCQPTALPLSGAESRAVNSEPTLNHAGSRAGFWSTANPVNTNPDRSIEIFVADTSALTSSVENAISQVSVSRGNILGGFNVMPDLVTYVAAGGVQRTFVVFASDRNYEPESSAIRNDDGGFEIFLAETEPTLRIWQLTNTALSAAIMPSISAVQGNTVSIAYLSDADANEAIPRGNNRDRNYEVHLMTVDLAPARPRIVSQVQLTDTPAGAVNDQPVVSADGTRVVWLSTARSGITAANGFSNPEGNREVFVTTVQPSNRTVIQVTKSSQGDNDLPDINENGTKIAFASTVTNYPAATSTVGGQSVYRAVISGNNVTFARVSATLRTPVGRALTAKEPAISADGDRVVFAADGCDPDRTICTQPAGLFQVFVADAPTGSGTQFALAQVTSALTRTHEAPALSGDGQRIALVTTQESAVSNPDQSGSEIVALECRVARLGPNKSVTTLSPALIANRPDVGDTIAFRVALENTSFSSFEGTMVMTDTLPLGLTFLGATVVEAPDGATVNLNPASYNPSTRRLVWSVVNLPKTTQAVVQITARVNAGFAGRTLTNQVVISTPQEDELDEQGITNFETTASAQFRVTQVDLSSSLNVSQVRPREGQVFTYTVNLANPVSVPPGSSGRAAAMDPATNVRIATTLGAQADLEFIRSSTTGLANAATYNPATGLWTVTRLNPGENAQLHVAVRARPGAGGKAPLTVTLQSIMSDQEDINTVNNISNASRAIRVLGTDLQVVRLTASHAGPPQGTQISLALALRNRGPLPNLSGPPTDVLYTQAPAAFVPAIVEATANVPAGLRITGVSDNGIVTPSGAASLVTWQVPGWTTGITRTLTFTGIVEAGPGTELNFSAGNLVARFAPPGSATMNDPVPANNGLVTESVRVNSPANIPLPDPTNLDEGGTVTMPVEYNDDDLEDTHTITVDWGDGSAIVSSGVLTRPVGSVRGIYTFTHVYADDPPGTSANETYTINVLVTDSNENVSGADVDIVVRNVPPTAAAPVVTGHVKVGPPAGAYVIGTGAPLRARVTFTDPGFTGNGNQTGTSPETFRYRVDWGDGTPVTDVPVTVVTNGAPGVATTGVFTATHPYATTGQRTVTIWLFDDDMASGAPAPVSTRTFNVHVNNPPNAVDDTLILDERGVISANILTNDVPTDDALTLEAVNDTNIRGTLNGFSATGFITYTAARTTPPFPNIPFGFAITDTLPYTIVDTAQFRDSANVIIRVNGVNEPPAVDLNGAADGINNSATFTEDAPPVVLAAAATVIDPDNGFPGAPEEIAQITLRITTVWDGADEVLAAPALAGMSAVYDSGTGTLTITDPPPTTAQFQAMLRTVTYANANDNPILDPRVIEVIATDRHGAVSPTAMVTVTIVPTDDPPVVTTSAGATAATESQTAVQVDAGITVTDVDSLLWTGGALTATITSAPTSYDRLNLMVVGPVAVSGFDVMHNGTPVGTIAGGGTAQVVVTFNNSATPQVVQNVARAIGYARVGGPTGAATRTIEFQARSSAGGGESNVATKTINVTYINNPPQVTVTPPVGVLEDTLAQIRSSIVVTDVDAGGATLGFTITVSNGTLNVAGGGLTVVGNNASTIRFGATLAQWNAPGVTLSYQAGADYNGPVTLTVTVNDQGNSPNTTIGIGTGSVQFQVMPVNDAPVVDLNGAAGGTGSTATFTEGGALVAIAPDAVITDIDSANLASLTVQLAATPDGGSIEVLAATPSGSLTVNYNNDGLLTISGTGSVADYQAVLRSVTYSNSSQAPSTTARTANVIANDGALPSNTATSIITVVAVNDPPTVTLSDFSVVEDTPTDISSNITIADVDAGGADVSTTLVVTDGTLTITGAGLAVTPPGGGASVTAVGTVAEFNAATITYTPAPDIHGARRLSVNVNDQGATGTGGAQSSGNQFAVITITPVNDAPVVDLNGAVAGLNFAVDYEEGEGVIPIVAADALITDVDSTQLSDMTITLPIQNAGEEFLSVAPGSSGLVVGYNGATGVLTLTGNADLAVYQTVLRTLTYQNTSTTPVEGDRVVTVVARDIEGASGDASTSTISVSATNDPPVIDLNGPDPGIDTTVTFTEDGGAIALVQPTFVVTDVDSPQLQGAVITITNRLNGAAETLSATSSGGVTASFDSANNRLLLQGIASPAAYRTVLASVRYNNTSQNPTTTARSIQFRVVDNAGAFSAVATSTVNIVAVNDPPALDLNGNGAGTGFAATFTEDGGSVAIVGASGGGGLTITDIDSTTMLSATVTLAATPDGTAEVLSATASGGITVNYDATARRLALSGSATLAQYQTVLRTVRYNNTSQNPTTSARSAVFVVYDAGAAASAPQTSTITVNAVPTAPTIATNLGMTVTHTLPPTGTLPFTFTLPVGSLVATDPDSTPAEIVYTVRTLPANGVLLINNTPLGACPSGTPRTFTQADLDNGLVRYRLTTYTGAFTANLSFSIGAASVCSGGSTNYPIRVNPPS